VRLELGDYAAAWNDYNRMVTLRPDAQSYARVAHALELRGESEPALRVLEMAREATSAHDPEALAWIHSPLGALLLSLGRVDDAERELDRADLLFPAHPYVRAEQLDLAVQAGRFDTARSLAESLFADTESPEVAAVLGDLHASAERKERAHEYYQRAIELERDGWQWEERQPAALARMLAERDLLPDAAVALAEEGFRTRQDIHSADALAWAYFRVGRLEDAAAASARALRTGSRHRAVRYHAGAIPHRRRARPHCGSRFGVTSLDRVGPSRRPPSAGAGGSGSRPSMLLGALIDDTGATAPAERVRDRETVQRVAEGDAAALADIYDQHGRAVFGLALRVLENQGDAEDVVQEVFAQAWSQARRYDAERGSVAAWLLMIARSRAIDRLRARRTRPDATPSAAEQALVELPDTALAVDQLVASAESAARLRQALTALPYLQRVAIELAYFEGLTHTEIAARLEQSLGTIKARIRTGLHRLREALTE